MDAQNPVENFERIRCDHDVHEPQTAQPRGRAFAAGAVGDAAGRNGLSLSHRPSPRSRFRLSAGRASGTMFGTTVMTHRLRRGSILPRGCFRRPPFPSGSTRASVLSIGPAAHEVIVSRAMAYSIIHTKLSVASSWGCDRPRLRARSCCWRRAGPPKPGGPVSSMRQRHGAGHGLPDSPLWKLLNRAVVTPPPPNTR
jgi:hypothetical protein